MARRLDHLGIIVKDIDEAASLYNKILGLTLWDKGVVEDAGNGVRLLSLPTGDSLLRPMPYGRFQLG